jgi:hypothetical protein
VTAALAVVLRTCQRTVAVVKPARTGTRPGEPGDVDKVSRLAGPVDAREGFRLPDPLAPDLAALAAGVQVNDPVAACGLSVVAPFHVRAGFARFQGAALRGELVRVSDKVSDNDSRQRPTQRDVPKKIMRTHAFARCRDIR